MSRNQLANQYLEDPGRRQFVQADLAAAVSAVAPRSLAQARLVPAKRQTLVFLCIGGQRSDRLSLVGDPLLKTRTWIASEAKASDF